MTDKTKNEKPINTLVEASPILTRIMQEAINELFDGELSFTLFISDGKTSGLSGNNTLENTFESIRQIEEFHNKNQINYVHFDSSNQKH